MRESIERGLGLGNGEEALTRSAYRCPLCNELFHSAAAGPAKASLAGPRLLPQRLTREFVPPSVDAHWAA